MQRIVATTLIVCVGLLGFTRPQSEVMGIAPTPSPSGNISLSWAPVEGAISYRLLVFRDSDVILDSTYPTPLATVSLSPGAFRWVVFPVTESGVATVAVVDSVIDVE